MAWDYDAGEPYKNKKHGWNEVYAGVAPKRIGRKKMRVSRCPKGMERIAAQTLMNSGVALVQAGDLEIVLVAATPEYPYRIYACHDGVPYEARATTDGVSFHGCPVLPEHFDALPDALKAYLREQAASQGNDLDVWLTEWRQ